MNTFKIVLSSVIVALSICINVDAMKRSRQPERGKNQPQDEQTQKNNQKRRKATAQDQHQQSDSQKSAQNINQQLYFLPPEVLAQIFSHLKLSDLKNESLVCKKFNHIINLPHQAPNNRIEKLKCLISLVERNLALPTALEQSTQYIFYTNKLEQAYGLKLFRKLFEKGCGFSQTIEDAKRLEYSEVFNPHFILIPLKIYKLLVPFKKAFTESAEIVKNVFNGSYNFDDQDPQDAIKVEAFELACELLKQKQAPEVGAMVFLSVIYLDEYLISQEKNWKLLELLFNVDSKRAKATLFNAFERSREGKFPHINLASLLSLFDNKKISAEDLRILSNKFISLIRQSMCNFELEKSNAQNEAFTITGYIPVTWYNSHTQYIHDLQKFLIPKGLLCKQVCTLLPRIMNNGNMNDLKAGIKLVYALNESEKLNKEDLTKYIKKVMDVAQKALDGKYVSDNGNYSYGDEAFGALHALIKRVIRITSQLPKEIYPMILKGLQDHWIVDEARRICQTLVAYDQGKLDCDKLLEIVRDIIKSEDEQHKIEGIKVLRMLVNKKGIGIEDACTILSTYEKDNDDYLSVMREIIKLAFALKEKIDKKLFNKVVKLAIQTAKDNSSEISERSFNNMKLLILNTLVTHGYALEEAEDVAFQYHNMIKEQIKDGDDMSADLLRNYRLPILIESLLKQNKAKKFAQEYIEVGLHLEYEAFGRKLLKNLSELVNKKS